MLITIEVSNGTPATNSVNIKVEFSASNVDYTYFTFRVLMDGIEQKTDNVNVTATNKYEFTLTGSGSSEHTVQIMVVPVSYTHLRDVDINSCLRR